MLLIRAPEDYVRLDELVHGEPLRQRSPHGNDLTPLVDCAGVTPRNLCLAHTRLSITRPATMYALEIGGLPIVGIHDDQPPHTSADQDLDGRGPRATRTHDADGGCLQSARCLVAKRGSESTYSLQVRCIEPVLTIDMNRLAV